LKDFKAVFIELKSIGLDNSDANILTADLCDLVENELSVEKNRVYIEFVSPPGALWGWNGETFD
jgi:phenylpyruvate tautomerase